MIEWIKASEAKNILGKYSSRLGRLTKIGYIEYNKENKRYNKKSVVEAFKPLECNIDNLEELKTWYRLNILNYKNRVDSNKLNKTSNFYLRNYKFLDKIDLYVSNRCNSFSEKYYCLINNIIDPPKCKSCSNYIEFDAHLLKYHTFCSTKCSSNDEEVRSKVINTSLNNIDENGLNSIERGIIKSRITKLNNIDENGLNSYQRGGINSLISSLNNIDENGRNSVQRRTDKAKQTFLEKYGVDNAMKVDYFKSKNINSSLNNIDENGLNSYQRQAISAKQTRLNDIDENGLNSYQRCCIKAQETKIVNNTHQSNKDVLNKSIPKMIQTKISNGIITPREQKEDVDHYKELIEYYSNQNYGIYYNNINPDNVTRSKYEYHLDHMYSKHEGFKNNIPIWIICHPCNLEMLWCSDNISKSSKCSHTLEQLLEKIEKFEELHSK